MKNKCPSWRGEATVRPRRQGRRGAAFIGAKRKPLTEGADGSGAGFGQEEQGIPVRYGKKSLVLQLSRRQSMRTKAAFFGRMVTGLARRLVV